MSAEQQLVARIKRNSKYFDQSPPNIWFDVEVAERDHYHFRGNHNQYRVCDVVLGMRLSDGSVLDFSTGKTMMQRVAA